MTTQNDTPDFTPLIAARLRELDERIATLTRRISTLEKGYLKHRARKAKPPKTAPAPTPQNQFSQPIPATA